MVDLVVSVSESELQRLWQGLSLDEVSQGSHSLVDRLREAAKKVRLIQVGDVVKRVLEDPTENWWPATVLAVDGAWAWLKHVDGDYDTFLVSDLEVVDGTEVPT